jgi:prepilin-type N-terminal cleavage/methylation domain-containing protein
MNDRVGAACLLPIRRMASHIDARPGRAFTLIELLTVVAIIGILAGILVPTIAGARTAANKAKSRAQFAQWTAAFEAFRQEYGTYPQFSASGAQHLVNAIATTEPGGNHLFHDVLAGVHRDGSQLSGATTGNPTPALGQNTRRIRFVNFAEGDFVTLADVDAGRASATQLNFIRDAFFNTQIAVVTDSNLDGVINSTDSPGGYPAVLPPDGTTALRPSSTDLPATATGGVHAGVIFFSAPPGATSSADLIMSWK